MEPPRIPTNREEAWTLERCRVGQWDGPPFNRHWEQGRIGKEVAHVPRWDPRLSQTERRNIQLARLYVMSRLREVADFRIGAIALAVAGPRVQIVNRSTFMLVSWYTQITSWNVEERVQPEPPDIHLDDLIGRMPWRVAHDGVWTGGFEVRIGQTQREELPALLPAHYLVERMGGRYHVSLDPSMEWLPPA